jgi:hypothetical protein
MVLAFIGMAGIPTGIYQTIEHTQSSVTINENSQHSGDGTYRIQWEKDYGKLWWWSARYEGPQPVGDADNDGKNELLIGGRDPFMRVMKWDDEQQTYYEQQKIIDPVVGIGYGIWVNILDEYYRFPQPFGSATGFSIADIDNDGENEIGVAWGHHFSAFEWKENRYQLMGRFIVADEREGEYGTTLDCVVGDYDDDGQNEVVITGGYDGVPELVAISWDGDQFIEETNWDDTHDRSIYYPWIADVDDDGYNEIIVGPGNQLVVLDWDGNVLVPSVIDEFDSHVFGTISKDSDGDGKPEIHVTFYDALFAVYEWTGGTYEEKFNIRWDGEWGTIEAIDVGDVDGDGEMEVCVGTNYIHILSWTGDTYEEEYVITETHGFLAVTCVGDFDNDGLVEINAGVVGVDDEESYKSWIFKYGLE